MSVKKKWGYETTYCNEPLYCSKKLTLFSNGNASSIHFHINKTETLIGIEGVWFLEIYKPLPDANHHTHALRIDSVREIRPGMSITIAPLTPHRFYCRDQVARFLEVSTHDTPEDSIRMVESGPNKFAQADYPRDPLAK